MPTDRQRLNTLVQAGLLPETAQDIIETSVLNDVEKDARINAQDRARVQAFVLYSPLIPDHLRLLFSAPLATEHAD